MPFKSPKQRRYMWAKHPEIARRWEREEHPLVKHAKKHKKKGKR